MPKRISTETTEENIAAVLAILQGIPARLEAVGKLLSAAELAAPLGRNERSPTQILAHLINCEARTAEAIYLALLLNDPLIHKVHPERQWGKLLRPESLPFNDLLAYFNVRRTLLIGVLRPLTHAQWQRAIREENKKRQESVYWLARTIALHEREHFEELESKIGQGG